MKSALITGVTGQDGKHLTKLLLSKNYRVFGLLNGQNNSEAKELKRDHPEVILIPGDLTDFSSLIDALHKSQPDEIYNLGAISFVGMSFEQPELTANVTGLGPLRILEAIRRLGIDSKFYQASSSEMFGKVRTTPQNELTPFYPRSPYGVAKVFAHNITINYREAYGIRASCGILFNHEGENRGYEFVTRKITSSIAKIKLGKIKKFSLGNLEARRDWGYAGDYVEAMWLMMQQENMEDFVIATGIAHSVRDFVLKALECADLPTDIERFVEFDKQLLRPSEVDLLIGDANKAFGKLGWRPKTDFDQLVSLMVENDLRIERETI